MPLQPPISCGDRAAPVSIVLGDFVYIDGGLIADGQNSSGNFPYRAVNSTLSISLKDSWTNSTVDVKTIFKESQRSQMNSQGIWRDPTSKIFYVWGGDISFNQKGPPEFLWTFTGDGDGGGSWSREVSNPTDLTGFVRTREAAFAQSADTAYYLGGFAGFYSESAIEFRNRTMPVPGMLTIDMKTRSFKNISTTPNRFGTFGTFKGGAMQFVPFGSEGLLLVLGGWEAPVTTNDPGEWFPMDFNNLTIYDPKTDKWHTQRTQGEVPSPREKFCAVGVAGPNNTYDIFLYGGRYAVQKGTPTDEVYVLSLPGFVFFKASSELSTKRAGHACVGVGRRQVLSIGGLDEGGTNFQSWLMKDPWALGLGVFDMTQMRWTDGYDSKAASYEAPDVVKQWYDGGNLASVKWSNDEVRELFAQTASNAPTNAPGTSPSSSSSPGGSDSKPVGAIAGGVVGGVVGLALIVGLVLFFLRRKKRRHAAVSQNEPPAPMKHASDATADTAPQTHEVHADYYNPIELPESQGPPRYAPVPTRHEMAG
ncbi:kelch repeat protein [Colletotrichum karsti]|uniref:Kelch repeat protein n=1 Tax=Colletotrichum karsti TaxID=1095194 RepID=A0A9P6LQ60_9PEZI|nr:kelch repeat protein [Colletotrichum karsti]KAF9881251.1 kelch repeat protein [Colletotrichum karsti]